MAFKSFSGIITTETRRHREELTCSLSLSSPCLRASVVQMSLVAQLERHVLRFHVRLEPFVRQLAAEAAFLHAAEGALRRRWHRVVDADDAGLQALRHLP